MTYFCVEPLMFKQLAFSVHKKIFLAISYILHHLSKWTTNDLLKKEKLNCPSGMTYFCVEPLINCLSICIG
uniref:Uncharacterized protein n=1 Tax=Populus trichocarpa TaxID=3694 RepID=A0A2K1WQZ2_POPTR